MKRIFFALLFVVVFFCAINLANATGKPDPTPAPVVQPTPQPITANVGAASGSLSDADAAAAAAAKAKAAAEAKAAADAAALANGGDADAASYGAGGNVMSKNNSLFLNFPQPVWTAVPEAKGRCIVTNSEAGSIGWSFASKSGTKQGSDVPCMLENLFVSAMNNCHFESAELIRNRALKYMQPDLGDIPLTPGVRNLSHAECDALRRPRLALTPVIAPPPVVIAPPAPVAAPAPVAPVKKPVRKAAPKKPCDTVTVERQICVPKK